MKMINPESITSVFGIIGQYGLPLVLVVYFQWKEHKRDEYNRLERERLMLKVENLEQEVRKILTDLVANTTQIIVANSTAMKDWLDVLKIRPCIADELAREILERTRSLDKSDKHNNPQ